jgi:hypothetical protein
MLSLKMGYERFSESLGFVINTPWSNRVHVSPIFFALR